MAYNAAMQAGVMSPDAQVLAATYAQGLLDHLPDNARAQQAADELADLVTLLGEIDQADELLTMPLSVTDRCGLVERIFSGRLSEPTYALLGVMARRGRIALLGAVSRALVGLLDARRGKIEVTVTTALELTDSQRRRVLGDLERTFNAAPVLTTRIDPSILGGVMVQVGDVVYDASMASGLARFAGELTDRVGAMGARARADNRKRSTR